MGESKTKDTPSIFGRKKEKPAEEKSPPATTKQENAFTQDQLTEAWNSFRSTQNALSNTDKLILSKELTKGAAHEVIILLDSRLEVSFLEHLETKLVPHLRSVLKNDHLVIKKSIKETEESKKLYTGSDIYEFMVSQNPKLRELKERLGLDFDY